MMDSTNDAFDNTNGDNEQIKYDIINAIKNNDVEYIKKILNDPYFDPKSFVANFRKNENACYYQASLLFISCCYRVYEIIELLLEDERINVDNKTFNIVIHNKYIDVLKIFFNNKRTYNEIKNKYNYSDIHIFCALNDKHNLMNVLEDVNNNPNLITLSRMSALQLACQYEHYDLVKLLLEHPNIILDTQHDDFILSPFCQICFNGNIDNIDIINLFLDHPALCPSKEAAILAASKSNSVNRYEIIKLLLNDGRFDPNFVSDSKQLPKIGPIHLACIHNDNELFNLLINDCTSIDKNLKTDGGMTPLMLACSHNNIYIVKRLIEFEEVDPNDSLCYCCDNIRIDILKLLLEHPKITVSELNKAFLVACSYYDSKNVLKLLLSDNRINYNIKNAYGSTGLHHLCSNNLESGIKVLMTETDIDVTAVDIYGNTILHCLCKYKYNEGNNNISINDSLKYLLGDDRIDSIMRKCNKSGLTPMNYLCQNGNYEAIKIILVKYPDYDMAHIDHDECSYLMHACKSNNLDLIKFLIYEKDNDPLIISKNDENIFHIVCGQMCLNIIKFLIESEFGIDFNKLNNHNTTPFNHLCQSAINKEISSNELDAIKYLIDMPFIDHLTPDSFHNLTPLECFCRRNRQYSDQIIKYMIEHVENIVIPDKNKFNNDNIDKLIDKYRN